MAFLERLIEPSGKRADRTKKSLNQLIIEELAAAAAGERSRADFSDLVGRWTPDPVFDEILASQRRIPRKKWQ